LLTFFAAAKKVSAAPHRGEPNRPISNQGKANAVGRHPKATLTRPEANQGKTNAVGIHSKATSTRPEANQEEANAVSKQPPP
jgi:hypothetical protein